VILTLLKKVFLSTKGVFPHKNTSVLILPASSDLVILVVTEIEELPADKGRRVKHPPQFERGLLLTSGNSSILFISGTASILVQETIGKEDIKKQTIVTIENIMKVSDPARISKIVSYKTVPRVKFSLLRIYIKRQSDFRTARQICEKYFPGIPTVYVEADICRDDLLMEIEAEAMLER